MTELSEVSNTTDPSETCVKLGKYVTAMLIAGQMLGFVKIMKMYIFNEFYPK